MDFPPLSQSSEMLSLAPISDADVCEVVKRLKLSKSVGLDIPGFVIKGCSIIFVSILRHIRFNMSLTQQYLPTVWKEAAIVPVLKIVKYAAVSNYRPISILGNFSKLFELIIHYHVSHYVKCNHNQHGFAKSKCTVTNVVTFLDFVTPLVGGQRQAYAILISQMVLTSSPITRSCIS
jgi:hypothetical protein